VLRAMLIPLACAVLAGALVSPAAAMRVMSDDEAMSVTVAWLQGCYENFRCCQHRELCCPCSLPNCDYVEWCYGSQWNGQYYIQFLIADCNVQHTSPAGCKRNPLPRACCRWYNWEAQNPLNQDYCVTPLAWTQYYDSRNADWGAVWPSGGDPCTQVEP
jgi:hypothetical protein